MHWGLLATFGLAATLAPSGAGAASDDRVVELDRCVFTIAGARMTVSGTIGLSPGHPAIDLVARTPSWRFGEVELRDVVATAHATPTGVRACLTAHVANAALDACSTLPSLDARQFSVTWRLRSAQGVARGDATLVRTAGGAIAVRDGHADVTLPAQVLGGAKLARATIGFDLAGSVAPLDLEVTGTARSAEVALGEVALHSVLIPFALHLDSTGLRARQPVIATATDAVLVVAGSQARALRPSVTLADTGRALGGTVAWRAAELRVGPATVMEPSGTRDPAGRQTIAWTSIRGPAHLELGRGEVALDAGRIARGHVHALGGELAIEPSGTQLVVHARGLDLSRVLATVGQGHVEGTGRVDGELVVDGEAITGRVHARGSGAIRVTDAAWRARAATTAEHNDVSSRLFAALGDFSYSDLVGVVGNDPELRITARGHGARVPQQVELVFNLRGVRDAARRVLSRALESS